MMLRYDDFKKELPKWPSSTQRLSTGLETLKNNLERYFFAEVNIRVSQCTKESCHLVLEMHCRLDLFETILNFDNGNWGGFDQYHYSLKEEINFLMQANDTLIEIDELTLFLRDTAIVISNIYEHSIPDQLENILIALSKNYFQLTHGLTEVPYEIFVPVFEEAGNHLVSGLMHQPYAKKNYFDFWAVYFESQDDADIYEFDHSSFVPKGEIQMFGA